MTQSDVSSVTQAQVSARAAVIMEVAAWRLTARHRGIPVKPASVCTISARCVTPNMSIVDFKYMDYCFYKTETGRLIIFADQRTDWQVQWDIRHAFHAWDDGWGSGAPPVA